MKSPARLCAIRRFVLLLASVLALTASTPAARALEFTVLHVFPTSATEFNIWGNSPGNLTMDADGVMFGCTTQGGADVLYGVAFRLRPEGVIERLAVLPYAASLGIGTILWRTDQNSQIPDHSAFWWGGRNVICRLHAGGGFEVIPKSPLSTFSTYGTPTGQLIEVGGYFFGYYGGIFLRAQMQPPPLPPYTSALISRPEPTYTMPNSHGGLWYGTDGNMFGTALTGGISNYGYLYSVGQGGIHTTLVQFTGTSGAFPGQLPFAPVVEGNDGILYGTTVFGGANDRGTVYRVWKDGSNFQTLTQFGQHPGYNGNPSYYAQLLQGSDGNYYGSTSGEIFRITHDGVLTKLVVFTDEGFQPGGGCTRLVEHADGTLYGTSAGPPGGIFKITGAQTAAPEIEVTGPAGEALTDGSGAIDWGLVGAGAIHDTTITIRNTGNAYLGDFSVSDDGANADKFTPFSISALHLAPGQTRTLTIRYSPGNSPGIHSAVLHIMSDDADEAVFDIQLTGQVSTTPYASWRSSKFNTSVANPTVSGPLADAERDGIPNAVEYALSLEPMTNNPTPWQAGTQTVGPDQYQTISFSVSVSFFPTDATLIVEEALSLEPTATWTTLATKTGSAAWAASNGGVITQGAASGGRIPVTVRSPTAMGGANTSGFLRLRVQVP